MPHTHVEESTRRRHGASCWLLLALGAGCASSVHTSHQSSARLDAGDSMACSTAALPGMVDLSGATQLVSGPGHLCALTRDRTVRCRGLNVFGQLGVGDQRYRASFTPVLGLVNVVQIGFTGVAAVCTVSAVGEVWCWGSNLSGELGNGHRDDHTCESLGTGVARCSPRPVRVVGIPPVARLEMGWNFVCAIATDRSVWCWGTTFESGRRVEYASPFRFGDLEEGAQFALVRDIPVVVRSNGAVVTAADRLPARLPDIVALRTSFSDTLCVITRDRRMECMGSNFFGTVGAGRTEEYVTTMRDVGLQCVVEVAMAYSHVCARHADGHVSCWGSNNYGEVGPDNVNSPTCGRATPCVSAPVRVQGIEDAVSVSVGNFSTCVIRRDRSTWCWGAIPPGHPASARPRLADWE